jgi:hypothetical protein
MRKIWTRSDKLSLAALIVAVVATALSFLAPLIYHWADSPEVEAEVARAGVVWVRYMGDCKTEDKLLTAVLRDGQPACPTGKLQNDNYFITIPLSLHNQGREVGTVRDLTLTMQTPRQQYVFEPTQLEKKTVDGIETSGHLPDPITVPAGGNLSLLVGFRSALAKESRLQFTPEDEGDTTLRFTALVDGEKIEREFTFEFVGYIKTTGFVAWREGQR